jgi:hypothetical protein
MKKSHHENISIILTIHNKRDIIKDTSEELMMLVLCGISCSIVGV